MPQVKLYGRLGTRAEVDAKIANAKSLEKQLLSAGWGKLEIKEDTDAETVEILTIDNGNETPLMKALHKGGGEWLCMYNPQVYPKPN